uniref:Uncharacterized protein n=1 Tax=Anopheles merus TaxID=30066 RepID=A0A182UPC0_ANOME
MEQETNAKCCSGKATKEQDLHEREAYRRWGCSVFIPYFTSRDDIKSVNNKTGDRDSDRATQGKSNAIFGDAANKQTEPNMNDANKQQLFEHGCIALVRSTFAPIEGAGRNKPLLGLGKR